MIDEPRRGHSSEVVQVDPALTPSQIGESRPVEELSGEQRDRRLRWLVEEYFDFVWRSLRRFGLSDVDADDATQRVFVVASRKLSLIERGKEKSFLFGTAYRVLREMRRTKARRPESPLTDALDPPDTAPDPEEIADRARARTLLDQVLAEMSTDTRSVFVLFELEELTVPEIATLLELPIGTVSSRLRRGRELFRAAAARLRARAEFHGGG